MPLLQQKILFWKLSQAFLQKVYILQFILFFLKMRGKYFSLLLLFLLFSSVSLAFIVEISPKNQKILLNESAVFNLTIKHSSLSDELFELYSPDVLWDIRTGDVLRVPSHEVFSTKLIVRPLNVNPGIYGVPLIFRMVSSGEKVEDRVTIETASQYLPSDEYLPAVKATPAFKTEIDPREPYEFVIDLENKNRRNLSVVKIKVRSNVLNKDYTTSLGPLEKKKVKFIVNFDPLTKPQKDVFYVTLLVPEQERAYQFDLFPTPVRIISYGGIEENVSEDDSFLKSVTHVKLINKGNGAHYYTYSFYAGSLKRLFLSSSEDLSIVRNALEWDVFLEPGESAELFVIVNYRPVFWAFVIFFVIIFGYFVFRSPVIIKKSARVIRTREGGISDVKVVLNVIHRGYRKVANFEMIDLIPKIATYIPDNSASTVPPENVTKSESKGTLVKWNLGQVEPKEHRIITYSIRSKLSILGGLRLPVAVAKFRTDYRVRETTSNPVVIKFSSE
ncbi:hypothetical protein DRJ25_01830 [Candidatus Woesearchaeota archaeon]|nr:MAG: hypothetical protein DRJ25_01830 [Candidatus Woesearchaeota archaeon]